MMPWIFLKENYHKRVVVTFSKEDVIGIISQKDLVANIYARWTELLQLREHDIQNLINFLQKRNEQLEDISLKDPLTGVFNRRKAEIVWKERCAERAAVESATFILMDIDDFKVINDKYGHDMGDNVLVRTPGLIRKVIRDSDLLVM